MGFPEPFYRWRPHPWHGLETGPDVPEIVTAMSPEVTVADGDLLDICVISERAIDRSEIMMSAGVVGGLRMIDNGEADDKIVAVLLDDAVLGGAREISENPEALVSRLEHHFLTYKTLPGEDHQVEIPEIYGRDHALGVVSAAMQDYEDHYGT
jgi:inorganic pyrophosphatase